MAEATVLVQQDSAATMMRQAGMLIGIAASVALGAYVVMWARTPNYTLLFPDLADRDITQVADALQASEIPYRIDPSSGGLLIAASKVHEAKLKLASAGLPKGTSMGFELMDQDQGFGTSQFLERARYQRAIEGELSRSISRINNVRAARVHLGLPPETVFSRTRREPTASVIVDLFPGRNLDANQVGAITHLVSASVPNLPTAKVTVVDQLGNLLTDSEGDSEIVLSGKRFEYRRRVEQSYVASIEAILMPFVGADGVRAEVNADIDFTTTEQTRETFNPDLPAVRSEKLVEEQRVGAGGNGGVPGALSNEPPSEAVAPETTAASEGGDEQSSAVAQAETKRSQSTRNYELDRTISHTKPSTGTTRRLSVAVVVRDKALAAAVPAEGEQDPTAPEAPATAQGFSDAEIEKMTNLVKDAIGFEAGRGDTVSVTAVEFLAPPTPEALPEVPIWKQAWVWDIAKQALGGLFVLFLLFGVLRPVMKSLMKRQTEAAQTNIIQNSDGTLTALPAGEDGAAQQSNAAGSTPLLAAPEIENEIGQVRDIVQSDPKIAAQIVNGWVND